MFDNASSFSQDLCAWNTTSSSEDETIDFCKQAPTNSPTNPPNAACMIVHHYSTMIGMVLLLLS